MAPASECVCKVCTCGRHKCPGVTSGVNCPFEGTTEYHVHFTTRPIEPTPSYKPVQKPYQGGEFKGVSESKEKFVAHQISGRPMNDNPQVPKKTWSPSEATFDGTTTNHTDFKPFTIKPQTPKAKAVWTPTSGKFTDETTSKTDYRSYTPDKVQRTKAVEKPKYAPNPAKFEGESCSKSDFKAYPLEKKFVREQDKWKQTSDDRDFKSVTNASYTAHQVTKQKVNTIQAYTPNPEKFQGTSLYSTEFKPHEISKPAPKQAAVAQMTPETRDFGTTSSSAYTGALAARTKSYKPDLTPPPGAKFEGQSTLSSDYQAWPVSKPFVIEKAKYVPNPSKFEGSSEYNNSFLAKSTPRYQHQAAKYVAPETKFEGISTSKSDFSAKQLPPKFVRTREPYVMTKDDRDFTSVSKAAFEPKPVSVCPAATRTADGKEKGSDGHLYFKESKSIIA